MADSKFWSNLERVVDEGCGDVGDMCLLNLRARVEALEGKYETMRLATLDWGEDIDNHSRWIDDQLKRIEALEAAANDRQQNEDNERAMPDAPPADGLVQRVAKVIAETGWDTDSWEPEARAAIREVAAWIRQNEIGYAAATWLEREAKL